jgi:hypothetical protein
VIRGPQAPPIRRYTPAVQYSVESVDTGTDHTIIVDTQYHHTLIVPLPNLAAGYMFVIKRIDANVGVSTTIRCNAATGHKFDGVVDGSYVLDAAQTVTLQNDGTDWHVISKL